MTGRKTGNLSTQKEAIAEMPAPLKEVYNKIYAEVNTLTSANILCRYRVGCLVLQVTNDERMYGEAAIPMLAIALGGQIGEAMLWECRRLSKAYTEKGLTKIMKMKTSGGNPITYNHLRMIAGLNTADARKASLKSVVADDLTTAELAAYLQDLAGGKQAGGGRKPKAPKTIVAGLAQIDKYSLDIDKRMDLWSNAVFDRCIQGPADAITASTLQHLTDTETHVSQMIAHGETLLKQIEESRERAERVLSEPEETADSKAPADGKDPKPKKKAKGKGGQASAIANAKKKATKKKKSMPSPA